MIIRRKDFGRIEDLTEGSQKEIWFICDDCNIGVLQSYRNYLKQKNGHFCRSCRNKNTANRIDVKTKIKEYQIKRWKDDEHRKHMSKVLSDACKKSWNKNDKRKKWLSDNNPMKNEEIRKKVIEKESTSIEELKNICKKYNYEYIDRILGKRGGCVIKFKCPNNHIQEKRLDSFRAGYYGCYECSKIKSTGENELYNFLKDMKLNIIENDRKIIYPQELDIVIPDKKIAIEYCGLYWHSELAGKDKNYHLKKLEECNKNGYKLITIFEDEWISKKDIVKRRLKHILGLSKEKIYARKCTIREIRINEARNFINQYHIQGYSSCSIKLGAFYNNDLVAVMTFSKPSLSKGRKDTSSKEIFELSRFCTSKNIVGITSKLLKYFQRNYNWKSIYSFADRRWSIGNVYEKIGFNFEKYTKENYFYFKDNKKRYHRFNFRKNILYKKLEVFDERKTEWKNMTDNGWNRIFDCGNILYKMENNLLYINNYKSRFTYSIK